MFESYHLWWASVIITTVVVLASVFLFILYSYLVSRMPKAVWLRKLEEQLLALEGKVHVKEEALRNLTEEIEKQKKLAADLKDAVNRLERRKNEAKQWLDDHKDDIVKIGVWTEKIASLTVNLEDLEKKLVEDQQKREDALRATSEAKVRLAAINAKVKELKSAESSLKANIETLQKEYDELRATVAEIKATYAEEKARLETLQAELQKLEEEIEAMQAKLESTEADKRETEKGLQDAIARKEGVKKEIKAQQKTLKSLGSMVANMDAQIRNFQPPEIDERLQDFRRRLLKLEDSNCGLSGSVDEKEMLEKFQETLRESGYIFHERTIHSFHTSLKIADIAPLVVLSGISGTGKSQLPRLYAKYMGMQFLNVSVQPRWDAPEDLFGFYNYMEHRYKATELARALRQMDAHYHSAEKGCRTDLVIQNGMLLVLLDEMNLARVEYYFSELLSKLEMRSRAQLGDEKMHERSAIQIQAGSLADGEEEKNQPLFVGYNVLFVGTMNEDETTQALSDKVLDRANVLRFGKPSECKTIEIEEKDSNHNKLLSYEGWDEWVKVSATDEDSKFITDGCKRINDALQIVGRSFGYRLHRAIEQYVANYPDVDDRLHKAFADQVEQKILPRLRGLSHDTDEGLEHVFNVLAEVIEELQDPELADAFAVARRKPVFNFKGVPREA